MSSLSEICYPKNFLAEVIAKVDFVSPVEELHTTLPPGVARAALRAFQIDAPKPGVAQAIKISMAKNDISSVRKEFIEWNFFGLNREKRLTISPEAILSVHNKYERFENFRDEFCDVAEALFTALPQVQASRIGLRFVNKIATPGADPLNWSDHINPELLGAINYGIEGAQPARLFHILEFNFGSFNLRFQYGIHNPDFPAPIKQRQFILDFDAYYHGLLDPGDIRKKLELFHSHIQTLFERSITKDLRDIMYA